MSAHGAASIEIEPDGRTGFYRCIQEWQDAQPRGELEFPVWEVPTPYEVANERLRIDGVPEAVLPMLRASGISFRRILT